MLYKFVKYVIIVWGDIMIFNFYQLLFFFFIYAILGWCTEVIYAAVNSGKFVNRGFLNGPYCPIYGLGVITVVIALYPIRGNLLILFAGSVALTTALEFVTGYMLERIFNQKWWDYSDEHFNVKGYVCLRFSLLWGLACVLVVSVIHPGVVRFVDAIPRTVGIVILCVLLLSIASDIVITMLAILHIKRSIRVLNAISAEMKTISDFAGGKLYDGVNVIIEQKQSAKEKYEVQSAEYKAKIESIKLKLKQLSTGKSFVHRRIETAFPMLKVYKGRILKDVRDFLEQHKL